MTRVQFEMWEQLQVKKDGDCYVIVRPDFVDLQSSPAVFYQRDSWQGKIISEWINATPLLHLPLIELCDVLHRLYKDGNDA